MIRNENSLLELLVACSAECNHCIEECLHEKDVQEMVDSIAVSMDCAAICKTGASYVARHSGFAENVLGVCQAICEACANECMKHAKGYFRRCARICRECAALCKAQNVIYYS